MSISVYLSGLNHGQYHTFVRLCVINFQTPKLMDAKSGILVKTLKLMGCQHYFLDLQYVLPPFVIFDRPSLRPELTDVEVPGTIYGLSRKGWIDSELFEHRFCRQFLVHAPPIHHLFPYHGWAFKPAVVSRAAEEGTILFTLPPHTSHLTQPLDKGCFGPLKKH